MVVVWSGDLDVDGSQHLSSLIFTTNEVESANIISSKAQLSFLAAVDISQIPLSIFLGPRYSVTTAHVETERWFENSLLGVRSDESARSSWWNVDGREPELGILVSVRESDGKSVRPLPRITEVLLYAARSPREGHGRLATPPPSSSADAPHDSHALHLYAVGISSDLLHQTQGTTPPPSPRDAEDHVDAVFLSLRRHPRDEIVHEPLVRKRKSVTDTFDEAAQRRQRARHAGGLISTKASDSHGEDGPISLKQHRRSVSNVSAPLRPGSSSSTPRSRSPVLSAPQAPLNVARNHGDNQKRSSLSHVQSVAEPKKHVASATELANKDFISRIVMAGMRFHGLSQTKGRLKSRPSSAAGHSSLDASVPELEVDTRRQDEEFKLVYHQVFKGTTFAFRQHISSLPLQPHTELLRDTVDRLLAMFCEDPLAKGLPDMDSKLTPGGRKAFGSASTSATVNSAYRSTVTKVGNT